MKLQESGMKKDFWAIWHKRGVLVDEHDRPLIFSKLVDAKVWMIKNPNIHSARIVKCHIKEEV